jgi:hypothetical protein
MATAIVSDTAVAVSGQADHLVFPRVRAEWPTMTEDDGLSRAPVLVIDFVVVAGIDRRHVMLSFAG